MTNRYAYARLNTEETVNRHESRLSITLLPVIWQPTLIKPNIFLIFFFCFTVMIMNLNQFPPNYEEHSIRGSQRGGQALLLILYPLVQTPLETTLIMLSSLWKLCRDQLFSTDDQLAQSVSSQWNIFIHYFNLTGV